MNYLENLLGAVQVGGALLLSPVLRTWYNRWGASALVRQRLFFSRDMGWVWRLTEPVGFVMERKMMLNIRMLAERNS